MKKLNIMMVNNFFYRRGGAEVSLFETAKLLKDRGHKIIWFSCNHPKNYDSEYSKYFLSDINFKNLNNVKSVLKNLERIFIGRELKSKIDKITNDFKIDIVHLNNINYRISAHIIKFLKRKNIPIIMHLRDYYLVCGNLLLLNKGMICEACKEARFFMPIIKNCRENLISNIIISLNMYLFHRFFNFFRHIDYFISPSIFLIKKLKEMGFKRKIFYLPNFVNINSIEPEYNFKELCISYFGRISHEKGLITLLDAMKGLNIELKIIGDGPASKLISETIKKEKLYNVKLLSRLKINNLYEKIKKCMAVVLPSEWYENNPRTIIEAFSLGKPVIGSKIGGIPELIEENKNGFLFQAGDSNDLRKKIKLLLNDSSQISKMGKNARRKVEQKYNNEIYYQKLMKIYGRL